MNAIETDGIKFARASGNWFGQGQDFYIAFEELYKIHQKGRIKLKKNRGKSVDINALRQSSIHYSLFYLLGFSFELLLKALLIQKDPEKIFPDDKPMSLGIHRLEDLWEQTTLEKLDNKEKLILERLSDFISWGKYPENIKPFKNHYSDKKPFHPYTAFQKEVLFDPAIILREKAIEEYIKKQDE